MKFKIDWRVLALAIVVGVCVCLVLGFVENPPEFSVIGHRYYGWPLVWRITKTLLPEEYRNFDLLVDFLFWIFVVLIAVLLAKKLIKG